MMKMLLLHMIINSRVLEVRQNTKRTWNMHTEQKSMKPKRHFLQVVAGSGKHGNYNPRWFTGYTLLLWGLSLRTVVWHGGRKRSNRWQFLNRGKSEARILRHYWSFQVNPHIALETLLNPAFMHIYVKNEGENVRVHTNAHISINGREETWVMGE